MISPLPPQETGESPYTARLIKELVRKHDLKVTVLAGEAAEPLDKGNRRIETKSIWNGRDLLYPFKLVKKISKIRPHLVHIQFGPHGRIYGGFFGEIMLLLIILLKAIGIKTTVTLHSTWMPNQVEQRIQNYGLLSHLGFLARPAFKLYMKLLDLGTTTIQLSTSSTDSELRRQFIHHYAIEPDKVLEIPHPCRSEVEIHDKDIAARKLGLEGKKIVLIFGFIREGKGLELAIEAMQTLRVLIPDSHLVIAGRTKYEEDEKYLADLKSLRSELKLDDHVRFDPRFIPEEEIPYYLSAASAILVPYTESVGTSGPVHNFAAYGTPVVAADVGHHMPEMLGGSLVLFKSGNSQDLAHSLEKILSDREYASEIGKKHREYAKQETWQVAARRTIRNYKETLEIP
jgi:glycosyltransferase involved in cell wall biosynthesis